MPAPTGLGLEGDGHRAQMALLLDGVDPRTGEQLGQKPRPDGVRAYDLTFSAPKGVSVLAGIVGGDTEREVIASHDAAVKAALGVLEERATTRSGKNGIHRVDAGGLTSLLVRHRTSRSLDPQLHTHALVFAKVPSADGRWRALDAGIVFRAQRMFGAAYQSALRSELTTRLGVEWGEVTKGQADVAGLDPELLGAFSHRSEQVARAAEQRLAAWRLEHPGREPTERERAIIARDAARESRPAKDHSRPAEELRADHLAVAGELGWSAERVSSDVLSQARGGVALEQVTAATEARIAEDVVAALAQERSVWSTEHVERAVLERLPYGEARDARAQLLEAQRIAREITQGACLDLAELAGPPAEQAPGMRSITEDSGVERYTTRELLEQEQRILRWFERSAAVGGAPASPEVLARAESAAGLDAEQAQAAVLVAGTDRAVVIVGPAGTGKTTTLRPVVEALRAQDRDVLGLAPTAVAAETLANDTGVGAENVAMFLTLHDSGEPPAHVALRPGGTLLIDEAGMLGTSDLERVLRVAGDQQLRVVLIGDGRQLFAVGRGGMFDQAREIVPSVEFGQVYRFQADWERPASLALRAGKPEAIEAYTEHGRVRSGTATEMNDAMLEDYFAARSAGQTSAFSVPTNDHARHLNKLVRERLIAAGVVNDELGATVRGGQRVGVGDEIGTRENHWGLRTDQGVHVKNRHRWTVQAVGADGSLTVNDPSRGSVTLPADYARAHTELAYFRTTHGVQSLTQDVGGSLVDPHSGFRDVYVGMTRGRRDNTAYVVLEEDQTADEVLRSALRRDRADLGVLAVRDRLAEDLRLERERQASTRPPRAPRPESERPPHDPRSAPPLEQPTGNELALAAVATAAAPAAVEEIPAPPVAARHGARIADSLAAHRAVLGPQRSDQLAARAAVHVQRTAALDRGELLAERDQAAPAWERLDRAGARETRSVQRDRELAAARAGEAIAASSAAEQQAAQLTGLRTRSERRALEQTAAVHQRIADTEQRDVDRLAEAEQQLHADGRHLDDWIARDGEQVARWLAAEHELASRRERTAADSAERAIGDPPEHVRQRIGDPPELGDPHRARWETLARRLEHDHAIADQALADGSTPPPGDSIEQCDVERQVRRLQRDLGIKLPAADLGLDAGLER